MTIPATITTTDTEKGAIVMCKVYGYCRVSRKEQSIERQIRNIKAKYPNAIIRQEAYTGRKIEGRKEFEKLIAAVKPGDTIIFDSVSRMSRNADEGIKVYFNLYEAGINLVFLKEPAINTETYAEAMNRQQLPTIKVNEDEADEGELIDDILVAVVKYQRKLARRQIALAFQQAQKEVDDNQQRTREGIETARLAGKQIGQVQGAKLTTKKSVTAKEAIKKYNRDFGGSLNDIETMKQIGNISRNSYYKYKRELTAELQQEQETE